MSYFAVILLLYPFGPFLASFLGCRPFFRRNPILRFCRCTGYLGDLFYNMPLHVDEQRG